MSQDINNILDKIFKADEQDVEVFSTVLLEKTSSKVVKSDIEKIKSGKPDLVDAPSFKISRNGYIEMSHGWHKEDYVWHIKPWHAKKQYRVTLNRVVYAIASAMNGVIPEYVKVDIYMPSYKWSIPEITFKAENLLNVWSVKDKDILDLNEKIFTVLNSLV